MKDIQGIQRGKCNKCECEEYRCPPPDEKAGEAVRLRCEYCNHTPVDHVKIIALGACKQCVDHGCDKYESESTTSYTDCQYCGCGAQHHAGAEKLIKKCGVATTPPTEAMQIETGVKIRMDYSGNPAQTSQFGLCKCPGCTFPRRVEDGGNVLDFCSRTCSKKYTSNYQSTGMSAHVPAGDAKYVPASTQYPATATSLSRTGTVAPKACSVCRSNPANAGYDWCQRCYSMAQSQKRKQYSPHI